jgi:major membrane immunogen (membrane-anchored lipoprotein)
MKNKLILILGMLLYMVLITACSSDDTMNNDASEIQAIKKTVQDGTWVITYFFDSDHEETNHFNGFSFTFGEDGTLTASNGIDTHLGDWSVKSSNSSDDSNDESDVDFNVFFSAPSDFEELSDDWDILTLTLSKIELIDVSGGNSGTDYLTFEKL